MKNDLENFKFLSYITSILYPAVIILATTFGNVSAQQPADTCNCATIDFETLPGDSVYSGVVISDQYAESLGMTFMLEDSTFPHIADVGGAKTAFESAYGDDTPAPDQNIGKFFLTDDGLTSGLSSSPLLITFSIPVDSASGVMLDIDATEQFTIQALGDTGQVLIEYTVKAGESGTGDGLATKWAVKRDTTDIYRIRIAGKRTAAGFFGLGFDNFTSCSSLRVSSLAENSALYTVPSEMSLLQNYPNPFNPATKIPFTLAASADIELKVFNALGEEVFLLVAERLTAGTYQYTFDGRDLPSGIYFYQLVAGNYREVKKMVLLK